MGLTRRTFQRPSYITLRIKWSLDDSGVTMGWLLRLVTGGPSGKGAPDSSRYLND